MKKIRFRKPVIKPSRKQRVVMKTTYAVDPSGRVVPGLKGTAVEIYAEMGGTTLTVEESPWESI